MNIHYDLPESEIYAPITDDDGKKIGTLTRPAVLRYLRPDWTVSNTDGKVVLARKLRPTRLAIARALGLHDRAV